MASVASALLEGSTCQALLREMVFCLFAYITGLDRWNLKVTVDETISMTSDVSYLEEARRLSKLRETNVLDLAKRCAHQYYMTVVARRE